MPNLTHLTRSTSANSPVLSAYNRIDDNQNHSQKNTLAASLHRVSQAPVDKTLSNSNHGSLVLSQKNEVYRDTVIDILTELGKNAPNDSAANKLSALKETLLNLATNDQNAIPAHDLQKLASALFQIRDNHLAPKSEIAQIVRMLEKHFYSCFISQNITDKRDKDSHKYLVDSRPDTTHSKTVATNISLSAGLIDNETMGANIGAKVKNETSVAFSRSVDDEGIVGVGREIKNKTTGSLTSKISMTELLEKLHIVGKNNTALDLTLELSGSKTIQSKSKNYPSMYDYLDEKYSQKTDSYKKHQGFDSNNKGIRTYLAQKISQALISVHSLRHHQVNAFNQQDVLQTKLHDLTGKDISVDNSAPFQLKKTSVEVNTIEGNLKQTADLNIGGVINLGAGAGATRTKRHIDVNIQSDMVTTLSDNELREFYQTEIQKLAPLYNQTAQIALGEQYTDVASLFGNKNMVGQQITTQALENATSMINQHIDEYARVVRLSDNGDREARQTKHQIEKSWGVQGKGRNGILQSAEIMLATLTSHLYENKNNLPEADRLLQSIADVNQKIITPNMVYKSDTLQPLVSFSRIIPIDHEVTSFDANIHASAGVKNINLGAELGLAVTHKRVDNPYRVRAGDHIDVELKAKGSISVADLLTKITSTVATQVGVSVEALQSSVLAGLGTSTMKLEAGTTLLLRFFSPDWSRKEDKKPEFTHQVTRVKNQVTLSDDISLGTGTVLASPVNVNLGLYLEKSDTTVVSEHIGTNTLNYLLLRYGYCRDRLEKGGEQLWNDVLQDRENVVKLMHKTANGEGQLKHELDFIINEQRKTLDEARRPMFDQECKELKQDLANATTNDSKFATGKAALETILNWHLDASGEQAQKQWQKKEYNLNDVLVKANKKAMTQEPTVTHL